MWWSKESKAEKILAERVGPALPLSPGWGLPLLLRSGEAPFQIKKLKTHSSRPAELRRVLAAFD